MHPLLDTMQGRISMSWEMIPAPRHLFLVLCNPLHSVTCYEVRSVLRNPALVVCLYDIFGSASR